MVSPRMEGQKHPGGRSPAPRWFLAFSLGCAVAFILGSLQTALLSPARDLGGVWFLSSGVQLRGLDLSSSSQERTLGCAASLLRGEPGRGGGPCCSHRQGMSDVRAVVAAEWSAWDPVAPGGDVQQAVGCTCVDSGVGSR